jgi:tRNA 5-methylaminomethyl-2-thiouridine biosynthesis bifunctional protein
MSNQFNLPLTTHPSRVAIIGAGIAGCTLAKALLDASQGVRVTLIDHAGSIAAGASGNPIGLVREHPSPNKTNKTNKTIASEFTAIAASFAKRYYREVCQQLVIDAWREMEIAHQPRPDQLVKWQKAWEAARETVGHDASHSAWHNASHKENLTAGRAYYSAEQLSKIVGHTCEGVGLFERGGALQPKLFCESLVAALMRDTRFQFVRDVDSFAEFDAVIICAANGSQALLSTLFAQTDMPTIDLRLQPMRGQLSVTSTPLTPPLTHAVAGRGYIVALPNDAGYCFGATYDRGRLDCEVDAQGHQDNLASLAQLLPDVAAQIDPLTLQGRAALRATTPSRLPIADVLRFNSVSAAATSRCQQIGVLTGLGSRGLTWAPILASHVAAKLMQLPSVLEPAMAEAMALNRA